MEKILKKKKGLAFKYENIIYQEITLFLHCGRMTQATESISMTVSLIPQQTDIQVEFTDPCLQEDMAGHTFTIGIFRLFLF